MDAARPVGYGRQSLAAVAVVIVRVVDRGTSRAYEGVRIRRIDVPPVCIYCLGPRGPLVPYRFPEDGAWYTCDRWENPCGHVETYPALLRIGLPVQVSS